MNRTEVRKLIPEDCKDDFDGIVSGRILGASKHIHLILNFAKAISDQCADENDIQQNIYDVFEYFKDTRGTSSYAIVNALDKVQRLMDKNGKDCIKENVHDAVETYFTDEKENISKIIKYSSRVLDQYHRIMIFDYSSTVEKAVVNAHEDLEVIVPESRVINGGAPFVAPLLNAHHKVKLIPDASILNELINCDAVLIGAETFYPDGTAFNTAGSEMVAELSALHCIPFYVVTPLLKVDPRAQFGIYKKKLIRNMEIIVPEEFRTFCGNEIECQVSELDGVKPNLISFFITEHGVVRPYQIENLVKEEVRNAEQR